MRSSAILAVALGLIGSAGWQSAVGSAEGPVFSGENALQHIAKQVSFGPRVIDHPAKQQTIDYIAGLIQPVADQWVVQEFASHGLVGRNLWASFYPPLPSSAPDQVALSNKPNHQHKSKPRRIMLGAHWDTRPVADRDPVPANRQTPIDGANDGGSGVAVLLELARLFSLKAPPVTVDLVFFDLEDMGNINGLPFSIGARTFVIKNPYYRPDAGVIIDMVCDRNLVIPHERRQNSSLLSCKPKFGALPPRNRRRLSSIATELLLKTITYPFSRPDSLSLILFTGHSLRLGTQLMTKLSSAAKKVYSK